MQHVCTALGSMESFIVEDNKHSSDGVYSVPCDGQKGRERARNLGGRGEAGKKGESERV